MDPSTRVSRIFGYQDPAGLTRFGFESKYHTPVRIDSVPSNDFGPSIRWVPDETYSGYPVEPICELGTWYRSWFIMFMRPIYKPKSLKYPKSQPNLNEKNNKNK